MNNRIEKIKAILLKEKRIEVTELSARLDVSEVSVRKYLTFLEGQGFLLRRYGGAILAENPTRVKNYLSKLDVAATEKKRIAELAASLVEDGENIMLDAGSTTLSLARALRGRELRVVTNSVAVVAEFMDDEEVVVEFVGGTLRKASGAMVGPRAREALRDMRVDKLFMGCSGFDPLLGFSSENAIEAETKHAMLACAERKIILADHGKFDRPAFATFAAIDEVDMLLTDSEPSPEVKELLDRNHVAVMVAPQQRRKI